MLLDFDFPTEEASWIHRHFKICITIKIQKFKNSNQPKN